MSAEGVAKHTAAMCRHSIGEDPFNADNQEERNEPKKEKHVELQQCFALQDQMDDVKIMPPL